ncbi:MAG: hypothetical protein SGBAC_003812 [Bacillariaceae sp.]
MAEGSSSDYKDDDERLKKLMKAATGCDNVEKVRNQTLVAQDSVDSAREFLADTVEEDENVDMNKNAGENPKLFAPSPKHDEVLETLSISGPAPKPPARRTVQQPQSTQSSASSPINSEAAEQSSNMNHSSSSPAQEQQSPSTENDEEPNEPLTMTPPITTMTTAEEPSVDSDLNYKWISTIYVIGSLLASTFYLLEEYGSRPQRSFVASLNDVYIVFLPYIPCLIWTLLRLNQRQKVILVPAMDPAKKEQ